MMATMYEESKKRERVAKACVFCRKKKVKCDGNSPCHSCLNSHRECVYPLDTDKKPRAKRSKGANSQSFNELDTRLAKLEGLLTKLVGKMDEADSETTKSTGFDYSDEDTDKTHNTTPDSADSDTHRLFTVSEKYFGNHSNFHIFSENSTRWIFEKTPKKYVHLIAALENMPTVFALCYKIFTGIWFSTKMISPDQRKRLNEGWFPEDKRMVYDLLKCFPAVFLANNICSIDLLYELFDLYYNPERHRFKQSDLLVMNISLALCISQVVDRRFGGSTNVHSQDPPSYLDQFSSENLIQLQSKFFCGAIVHYEIASIMSDGIRTIQALLLFIIYVETSWVKSSINYILSSLAVRWAQEIGLHRAEVNDGLSEAEATERRKLWWYCEYFDTEISYRLGKPPLINQNDVSAFSSSEFMFVSFNRGVPPELRHATTGEYNPEILMYLAQIGKENYLAFFLNKLTKIRSESYTRLFSASSCKQSMEDIMKTVTSLNDKMKDLADNIDPQFKPRFYYDDEFDQGYSFQKQSSAEPRVALELCVSFQLAYFTHLLTLNRLISQIDNVGMEFDIRNAEVLQFRSLALDSTRTILHMVKKLDRIAIPHSCTNWLIFYPFGAFFNLLASCLNRPNTMETLEDMDLLIDVCLNYFGLIINIDFEGTPSHKFYNQRDTVTFLVSVIFLNIGIRIIEANSSFKIMENNKAFEDICKKCQGFFPGLFQKLPQQELSGQITVKTFMPTFPLADDDGPFLVQAFNSLFPGPTGYLSRGGHESKKTTNQAPDPATAIPLNTFSPDFGPFGDFELGDGLDQLFGSATPNFFFDNNIGL